MAEQKILYSDLKENFAAIKMEQEFKACSKSEKHSVHKRLLLKYDHLCGKKFAEKLDEDKRFISTHSNPSSGELKEILETIGSDLY